MCNVTPTGTSLKRRTFLSRSETLEVLSDDANLYL